MSGLAKERVLLVDDEPQALVALEALLSDRFDVLKAESAQSARNLLEQDQDIAVVITDQRMPAMTGAEFLAQLGDASSALRILVTGFADLSTVISAVNEGRVFAYVTKPWDPVAFNSTVDKAAEHFRLSRDLDHERQALRDQTAILNAILGSVGDGVIVTDSEGKFLLFNKQAEQLLGSSRQEASLANWAATCGVSLADKTTPLPRTHDPLALGMSAKTEMEVIVNNRAVSGATVLVTATPLLRDNVRAGSVALLHDVTQRRVLERQLTQAQKMEAIGQLAGGVAHDFNNLLAVIQSCGELLREGLADGDPKHDDVDQLLDAASRGAALTKQLLSLGRREVVRPKLLDLNAVVANARKLIQRAVGDRVLLATQLSPSLATVRADDGQIDQVLLNLAVNGRDAMPEGGTLTIETANRLGDELGEGSSLGSGKFVVLSVSDTGTGMDAETQQRIFEPFFTTKDIGRGTGLGLSTVYAIVQQCGGHVRVKSEVGNGTRFEIYLPGVEGLPSVPIPAPPGTLPSPHRTATILLVDDDDDVRGVAARILRRRGYTVLEARNAREARGVFARDGATIDLLLTDVVMPETTGPALAAELCQARPGMRVLYISGYSKPNVSSEVASDLVGYLAKPFSPRTLVESVRQLLHVNDSAASREDA